MYTTLQLSQCALFLKTNNCVPNRTLLYYKVSGQSSGPRYVTVVTIGSQPILLCCAGSSGRRPKDLVEKSSTDSATCHSCERCNLDTDGVLDGRLAEVTHSWEELKQGKSCTAVFHVLSNVFMSRIYTMCK